MIYENSIEPTAIDESGLQRVRLAALRGKEPAENNRFLEQGNDAARSQPFTPPGHVIRANTDFDNAIQTGYSCA